MKKQFKTISEIEAFIDTRTDMVVLDKLLEDLQEECFSEDEIVEAFNIVWGEM